ncbi:MAG: hypothetical protein JWO58_450 [Chitinophagaceae bacterium]|nr:hypothetical protein [Chitinophagaceae bacterium]
MSSYRLSMLRKVSLFIATILLMEALFPVTAYALTAGPGSPEFSTFTPVATSDMVNVFTGDLNYNLPVVEIPGSDGGGYALSLSYNSGVSSEEEASWVGFGWNLNPGSINRNLRGFPDDYKGSRVDFFNKTRPNYSITANQQIGIEVFGQDQANIGLSATVVTRVNNNQGYYISKGFGFNVLGLGLNMSTDPNGTTFSYDINAAKLLKTLSGKNKKSADNDKKTKGDKDNNKTSKEEWKKQSGAKVNSQLSTQNAIAGYANSLGSSYGLFTYSEAVRGAALTEYAGFAFNNAGISTTINVYVPIGIHTVTNNSSFNLQYNKYRSEKTASGYMYNTNTDDHRDYYVEKDIAFSPRTYFMGVPFNNSDVFNVSGEGVGGGFKYFPNNIGSFTPAPVESKTSIYQVGVEFMISDNVGVGVEFGVGIERNTVSEWLGVGSNFGPDGGFFRFNNDMGGEATYSTTGIDAAAMDWSKATPPGSKVVVASANSYVLQSDREGRSSYVDYHTYGNVHGGFTNDFDSTSGYSNDAVAQKAIFNQDGMRYVYGKPVYTRNETNLQVDTKFDDAALLAVKNRYLAFRKLPLEKNGVDYNVTDDNLKRTDFTTLTGEIKKQPYASSYLLTALTTSDYVDVNKNGLDNADFGGWTKFSYRQAYGGKAAGAPWYRYRTPYTGLLYQQNQISDVWDDVGSVVTGEKELDYLNTIETKTHIAYFVTNKTTGANAWTTGSGKRRLDGLSAADVTNQDLAAVNEGAKGNHEPEYLEKIVLFAKDRPDKPIKVVRFDYDYSLVQNVPNNYNGDFPAPRNDGNNLYNTSSDPAHPSGSGKLTLKRVWFEYEGTIPSKVSPYEFSYAYATSGHFAGEVNALYSDIVSFGNNPNYSDAAQNPDYTPYLLDQWGCVQPYGEERDNDNVRTHYQGLLPITTKGSSGWRSKITPNLAYDPAAWNLKSIKLPSGGEIHIQYEEKDYQYVQDRPVMAQASLIPGEYHEDDSYTDTPLNYETHSVTNPYYVVNAGDLGVDPSSSTQVDSLIHIINTYFRTNSDGTTVAEEKINFKFLYALTGSTPSLDDCTSEYISGYANLVKAEKYTLSGGGYGVKLTLGSETSAAGAYASIPRQACVKYVITQREKKLQGTQCQSDPEAGMEDEMKKFANQYQNTAGFSLQQAIDQVKLGFSTKIHPYAPMVDMLSAQRELYEADGYNMQSICAHVKEENSFIKLPMYGVKKGGGIRVKRLLMYDPGIESGDAALYGSEYAYVLENGTSSGVATNEPSAGREENPLVVFLPKRGQSWFSRITAGEDKEQSEGPIGESLLPSPSIGHSRVVVQNIHRGLSGTGFTIHQYFTVKDYPFDGYYGQDNINASGVSSTNLGDTQTKDHLSLPAGLFNFTLTRFWSTQGFRFIINSMHGQLKNISTYGGTYTPADPSTSYLTSAKEYTYFEPGEEVQMMRAHSDGTVTFENGHPGKEMEMAQESRNVSDVTFDFKLGIDVSITISWVPPIFVTVSPSFNLNDELIKTHCTSKIIRYPAIVKSVKSYQDGIYSLSENLSFDELTGQPAVVRTYDSYNNIQLGSGGTILDGSVYNFNLPAAYKYPSMGQKAESPDHTNQLAAHTATFVSYSTAGDPRSSGWLNAPKNVISASIQTFANGWSGSWTDPYITADFSGVSTAQTDLEKVWRPYSAYVYKADVASANHARKVYTGGYFDIDKPFNWSSESSNTIAARTGWLKSSSITRYSPHGLALEEVNAIGIHSANKFGYNQRMVIMSGQNARYGNIYFNDYETSDSSTSSAAHSGAKSSLLTTSSTTGFAGHIAGGATGVEVTSELNKGGLLKLWVKQLTPSALNPVVLSAQISSANYPMHKVASTGQWTLYEVRLPKTAFASSGQIGLNYNQSIYVDDVRFQPFEAQATCYVYDIETLRPIVVFDDQHFGLYYQYNSEGKLVRKLVETEEGLKTIQETQYNTPRVSR